MAVAALISKCRLCGGAISAPALSVGMQPISNRLSASAAEAEAAPRYPLEIVICQSCGLPQLAHDLAASEHFHDAYTYISGASSTWVRHCERYAEDIVRGHGLEAGDLVVEAGSNDGTLLAALAARGVRALGVEPSGNVADIARRKGLETLTAFFNAETAREIVARYGRPKVLIGNNVLAHAPDTNGFLAAGRDLIADDGALCFEFPHFTGILTERYFDTIYHEHYCYLGVGPLQRWAAANGMIAADAVMQSTHGGSLRVFLTKPGRMPTREAALRIGSALAKETALSGTAPWRALAAWRSDWRGRILATIAELSRDGGRVAGYAAASKASVLSNYLALTGADVAYCCDASPIKQGRFIPGSAIPIAPPSMLKTSPPDAIIVFAWNIFDELVDVLRGLVVKPTRLIRPLPDIEILSIDPRA